MKVSELMTEKVEFTTPMSTTKEAARTMHDLHIGALPVVDNKQLVGIITDRDICCKVTATGRDAGWTKVDEVMEREVVTCFDDQDVDEAGKLMEEKHIRRLAVLNRDSGLVGFLSVDDLARSSHDLASTVLKATMKMH